MKDISPDLSRFSKFSNVGYKFPTPTNDLSFEEYCSWLVKPKEKENWDIKDEEEWTEKDYKDYINFLARSEIEWYLRGCTIDGSRLWTDRDYRLFENMKSDADFFESEERQKFLIK